MIKTPYNSACVTPCARLADFLVKKLTVRGTIGKMQGMKKAKNPPMTPAINIPHKDLLSSWGLLSTSPVIDSVPAVSMSGAASPAEKTKSSGTSTQALLSTEPSSNVTSSNEIKVSTSWVYPSPIPRHRHAKINRKTTFIWLRILSYAQHCCRQRFYNTNMEVYKIIFNSTQQIPSKA